LESKDFQIVTAEFFLASFAVMLATMQPQNHLIEHRWSPYTDNGGTCLGVAGKDHAILVADTRMSKGYSIHTRSSSKVTQLTDKVVIASCGMKADAITLHKMLKARIVLYEHDHRRQPGLVAIAQMLSTVLYGKRFFPYYTFNVLAGVDDQGVGGVYHYDAIGSFERVPYTTSGSGSSLVMSVLDCKIQKGNQVIESPELDFEGTINLCKDVMSSVGERDIFTGDAAEVWVIDKGGVRLDKFELKLD
jgi:20S proteasome subunit beta 6